MIKENGMLIKVTEEDLKLLKKNPKEFWAGVSRIEYGAFSNLSLTKIKIPDTVMEISDSAFYNCKQLKDVKLPKGLEVIPNDCFIYCDQLKDIGIPKSVKEIGENAFFGTQLKTVKLPNNLENIGRYAFDSCKIKRISIPQGVKKVNRDAFKDCKSLEKVVFLGEVETIGDNAFKDCHSLKRVNIPKSVREIGAGAFTRTALEEVIIPEGVEEVKENAFAHCFKLKEVQLPTTLKFISNYAFANSTNLNSVIFPDDLIAIEEYSFMGSGLTELNLPSSLERIENSAFSSCENLKEVAINGETVVMPYAFTNCNGLNYVTIAKDVKLSNNAFRSCSIDELNMHLNSFAQSVFSNTKIDKLNILEGAALIPPETFQQMQKVREIVLPNTVKIVGRQAFAFSNLEKVTLSENLKILGIGAFISCKSLTEINLPDGLERISRECFFSCKGLTNITIPDSVTQLEDSVFKGCVSLQSAKLPSGIKNVPKCLFQDCRSLQEIEIPNGVTKIETSAFEGCGFKEIKIPDTVNEIGSYCFAYNHGLENVELSKNIEEIPRCAFADCLSLKSIIIPEGVKTIRYGAFQNCTNLNSINLSSTIKTIRENAFSNTNIQYLKVNKDVNVEANAFGLNQIQFVTFVGDEMIFSNEPQKEGVTIPYEFYNVLASNNMVKYFAENCSVKTFNNEMKPFKEQIENLTEEEAKAFYSLAFIMGCFSNEKLRNENGKELQASKSQKRSSLLASILNSRTLNFYQMEELFNDVPANKLMSDKAIKFISNVNGKEYVNIQLLKELEKQHKGIMLRAFTEFDDIEKRRTTINAKTGLPETVSWKKVFVQYFKETMYVGITPENQDIAEVFNEKGLEQYLFDEAVGLRKIAKENNAPSHILGKEIREKTIQEQVEEVKNQTAEILGDSKELLEDIYAKKFTFEFLDKRDPRNAIIGLYASCCATITGTLYGSEIARRTVTEKDVQNLVVRDSSGEIIAKGALYVNSESGYAVFNDFEMNEKYKIGQQDSGHYNSSKDSQVYKDRELIFETFMRGIKAFALEYDAQHPEKPLQKVNVGMGYNRLAEHCERYERETNNLTVPAEYMFNDALEEQYILYERNEGITDTVER